MLYLSLIVFLGVGYEAIPVEEELPLRDIKPRLSSNAGHYVTKQVQARTFLIYMLRSICDDICMM